MAGTTHLRSLQALELAIRAGSLTAAAARLGITPAAVGQRIRALEEYLGTDLILRGLSLMLPDLDAGRVVCPFPLTQHPRAPHSYRMTLRADAAKRPQVQRFAAWLRVEAAETQRLIDARVEEAGRTPLSAPGSG